MKSVYLSLVKWPFSHLIVFIWHRLYSLNPDHFPSESLVNSQAEARNEEVEWWRWCPLENGASSSHSMAEKRKARARAEETELTPWSKGKKKHRVCDSFCCRPPKLSGGHRFRDNAYYIFSHSIVWPSPQSHSSITSGWQVLSCVRAFITVHISRTPQHLLFFIISLKRIRCWAHGAHSNTHTMIDPYGKVKRCPHQQKDVAEKIEYEKQQQHQQQQHRARVKHTQTENPNCGSCVFLVSESHRMVSRHIYIRFTVYSRLFDSRENRDSCKFSLRSSLLLTLFLIIIIVVVVAFLAVPKAKIRWDVNVRQRFNVLAVKHISNAMDFLYCHIRRVFWWMR